MQNPESGRDGTREDSKRTERAGASMDSEFLELAERFRAASDPEQVKRLGDELGRMVFGEHGVGEKQIPRGLRRFAPRSRLKPRPTEPARNDKK